MYFVTKILVRPKQIFSTRPFNHFSSSIQIFRTISQCLFFNPMAQKCVPVLWTATNTYKSSRWLFSIALPNIFALVCSWKSYPLASSSNHLIECRCHKSNLSVFMTVSGLNKGGIIWARRRGEGKGEGDAGGARLKRYGLPCLVAHVFVA